MRRLWTERTVSHHGPSEKVTGAGLAPLPIQRPIPVWFGVASPPALRRAGRMGDGWFPMVAPGADLEAAKAIVDAAATDAGRDPAAIGMEGRATWGPGGVDALVDEVERWRTAGATHVSINTMNAGFASVDEHLAALGPAAENLSLT
jgi:alkanesulfonate monooxygenase SsuD/methylene tetrahydromethanopterin reductase-like flavin-dependent oxidoreductase (luciferase family)